MRLADLVRLGAVAMALGCAPTITIGEPCVRSGDCQAPLVCNGGRCLEECLVHDDCPLDSLCLEGDDGLGQCRLPEDSCDDGSRRCPDGLQCRASQCFDPCTSMCPAGGVCMAGVCERPPATEMRELCTASDECGPGRVCTSVEEGRFVCRQACTSQAECRVGDTSRGCALLEGTEGADVYACTLPCDLFSPAASGCPAGEACDALELQGLGVNVLAVECRPLSSAMLGQQAPCSDGSGTYDATACAAGFDCDGMGPDFVCQALCTVTGVLGPPCPTGFSCDTLGDGSVRYDGLVVGSCDPD